MPNLDLLLKSYVDQIGLIHHHLRSYDYFIDHQLQMILDGIGWSRSSSTKCYCRFKLSHPVIQYSKAKPEFLVDYFKHKITYDVDLFVTIVEERWDTSDPNLSTLTSRTMDSIFLCSIPMMVGSRHCITIKNPSTRHSIDPYENMGFFIIQGNMKVLITQEKLRNNYIFHSLHNKGVRSECRSVKNDIMRSSSTMYMYTSPSSVTVVSIPSLPDIPLFLILALSGLGRMETITHFIQRIYPRLWESELAVELLNTHLKLYNEVVSAHEAIKRIASLCKRTVSNVTEVLHHEYLPHISDEMKIFDRHPMFYKGVFLLDMFASSIMTLVRIRPPHDKDSLVSKRMLTSGHLLAILFRQFITNAIRQLIFTHTRDKTTIITKHISNHRMTHNIHFAFSTGLWGVRRQQEGIVQLMTTMNHFSKISHLRRINLPMNKEMKSIQPRQQHLSHFGMICNVEATEGKTCGLIKSMAIGMQIRLPLYQSEIIKILNHYLGSYLEVFDDLDDFHGVIVTVNNIPSYTTDITRATLLSRILKRRRRYNEIPPGISILLDEVDHKLRIETDQGCCFRPFINLQRRKTFLKLYQKYMEHPVLWQILVANGVIDFLTKEEEYHSDTLIAIRWKDITERHTHVELHPTTMMGLLGQCIPFSNHNQAPRNIYATCMMRQAKPAAKVIHTDLYDTVSHELSFVQTPLVTTLGREISQFSNRPDGCNVIMAFMTHPLNQEDSVVFNRASIDRGLFHSVSYSSFTSSEENTTSQIQYFTNPSLIPDCRMQYMDYSAINSSGLPSIGTQVKKKQVIIGKATRNIRKQTNTCHSTSFENDDDSTFVDNCDIFEGKDDKRVTRVRLRRYNIPQKGDKFCAMCGQKGTMGSTVPETDMPFDPISGMKPDVIINPHAIPSRMTIGLLFEIIYGIKACIDGEIQNGDAFRETPDMKKIDALLLGNGFHKNGHQRLVDGITGESMVVHIFQGPVFYQSLKHMVKDKVHARNSGPQQNLTRQPVEGRSRNGGLRVGEMEKDAIIAHGASHFLRDRLFKASDDYRTWICHQCNTFVPRRHGTGVCYHCHGKNLSQIEVPYGFKLLAQELESCHYKLTLSSSS